MSTDAKVEPTRRTWSAAWLLMLVPVLLLGIILALIVTTGGGLRELAGKAFQLALYGAEQLVVQAARFVGNAGHGGSVHHRNALRCRARRRDV